MDNHRSDHSTISKATTVLDKHCDKNTFFVVCPCVEGRQTHRQTGICDGTVGLGCTSCVVCPLCVTDQLVPHHCKNPKLMTFS